MNTLLIVAGLAVLSLRASAQSGGTFSIESSTVDSGGGVSGGGSFALAGTIGQPEPGHLTGGAFSLSGGFWSVSIIQTQGAPALRIRLTPGPRAVLTWPQDDKVWLLESSADLLDWTPVPSAPEPAGSDWSVTVPANAPRLFFRLVPASG